MDVFLNEWLSTLFSDKEAAVATMVNGLGSRPRENGAQMLIKKSGGIFSTVGGGKLEAEVIACAKRVLETKKSELYHFNLTGKDVEMTEMICGGEGDVFVYYSGREDIRVLETIKSLGAVDGWMLFPVGAGCQVSFISQDVGIANSKDEIARVLEIARSKDINADRTNGDDYIAQWIEIPGELYIMGAGHVSCEIAKVAQIAGIPCVVYDDRPEFNNKERFPGATCMVIKDMARPPRADVNKKDMIAIVTRGHLYDKECLEWALKTDAGYVGMIGSHRKRDMIFASLLSKGYPKDMIESVHAPIGLNIGALTPAEIAVAIVAELIQFKRSKK